MLPLIFILVWGVVTSHPTANFRSNAENKDETTEKIYNICGSERLEGVMSGTFQSPGYPGRYAGGTSCSRTIRGPVGSKIDLECDIKFTRNTGLLFFPTNDDFSIVMSGPYKRTFHTNEMEVWITSYHHQLPSKGFSCKFNLTSDRKFDICNSAIPEGVAYGTIQTSDYPKNIQGPKQCVASLRAPPKATIEMVCQGIDTNSCQSAPLVMESDGQKFTYCDGKVNEITKSFSSDVKLTFLTNESEVRNGFSCDFTVKGGESFPGCGQGSQNRIVGGREATRNQYPWMALMQLETGDEMRMCTGNLISNEWILTTASCLQDVASADIYLDNTPGATKTATSTSFHTHPGYSASQVVNDIGLVKFPSKITFTDRVKPICLPLSYDKGMPIFEDTPVHIAGWGKNNNRDTGFEVQSLITRTNADSCDHWGITNSQLCLGFIGHRACLRDGGGPAMVERSDGTFLLIGLHSYAADDCDNSQFGSVDTRVSEYIDFIHQITGMVL